MAQDFQQQAIERVNSDERLSEYRDKIFADWNETDHYEWVATADVDEIVDWAESIRKGAQE